MNLENTNAKPSIKGPILYELLHEISRLGKYTERRQSIYCSICLGMGEEGERTVFTEWDRMFYGEENILKLEGGDTVQQYKCTQLWLTIYNKFHLKVNVLLFQK